MSRHSAQGSRRSSTTWFVPGLKGTGSNDIEIKDVVVPDYRAQKYAGSFRGFGTGGVLNTRPISTRLSRSAEVFRGVSTGARSAR